MVLCSFSSVFLILYFYSLFSRTVAVTASDCAQPYTIPIRNVTISQNISRRGVPVAVGSSLQNFSLLVEPYYNNTIFHLGPLDDNNCNLTSSTVNRCLVNDGGVYDPDNSTTWQALTQNEFVSAGGSDFDSQSPNITGIDNMTLLSTDRIGPLEFPFGLIGIPGSFQGVLGLGTNSTILSMLTDKKIIPSRSWGYDFGFTGDTADTWVDGELVLGGYNKNRISGKLYTSTTTLTTCLLHNQIKEVTVQNSTHTLHILNNSDASQSATYFSACVDPSYEKVSMPFDWFDMLNQAYGSPWDLFSSTSEGRAKGGIYLWGFVVPDDRFDGTTMTISLESGFTTTIPSHELISPYREFDDDGQEVIDGVKRVLRIDSLQAINQDDIITLGTPFLSAAYLVVDNDNMQFSLAQPARLSNTVVNSSADLVQLVGGGDCAAEVSPLPGPPPTDIYTPVSSSKAPSPSTPAGALGGGVAGAVVACAIVGALVYYFVNQRRRRANQRGDEPYQPYADGKPELDGTGQPKPRAELDSYLDIPRTDLEYRPRQEPKPSPPSADGPFELDDPQGRVAASQELQG